MLFVWLAVQLAVSASLVAALQGDSWPIIGEYYDNTHPLSYAVHSCSCMLESITLCVICSSGASTDCHSCSARVKCCQQPRAAHASYVNRLIPHLQSAAVGYLPCTRATDCSRVLSHNGMLLDLSRPLTSITSSSSSSRSMFSTAAAALL